MRLTIEWSSMRLKFRKRVKPRIKSAPKNGEKNLINNNKSIAFSLRVLKIISPDTLRNICSRKLYEPVGFSALISVRVLWLIGSYHKVLTQTDVRSNDSVYIFSIKRKSIVARPTSLPLFHIRDVTAILWANNVEHPPTQSPFRVCVLKFRKGQKMSNYCSTISFVFV